MRRNHAKQTDRTNRDETAFIGELQRFSDPPGGAALDDPEVRARKRRGRPATRRKPASPIKKEASPLK
jgi:hypothetical protein